MESVAVHRPVRDGGGQRLLGHVGLHRLDGGPPLGGQVEREGDAIGDDQILGLARLLEVPRMGGVGATITVVAGEATTEVTTVAGIMVVGTTITLAASIVAMAKFTNMPTSTGTSTLIVT